MAEPLLELSASFQRHLRAEGRAKRTCALHEQAIRFFSDWLATKGLPADDEQCTKDNIRDWLADLADRVGPGTVRIRWAGMRRFTRWLVAEGVLDDYPMTGLGEPEVPEKPVPVLTDGELTALIKACAGKDFAERRDEAIIRLLLDCGLRVSELCGITVESLDLGNGSAMVTGKRGKVRQAFFGARTERALDRYMRVRRQHRWGARGGSVPRPAGRADDGTGSVRGWRSVRRRRGWSIRATRTGSGTRGRTTSCSPAGRSGI
jgi:site-specific recombinase XerD